mgnify:CR=1 FL=1
MTKTEAQLFTLLKLLPRSKNKLEDNLIVCIMLQAREENTAAQYLEIIKEKIKQNPEMTLSDFGKMIFDKVIPEE